MIERKIFWNIHPVWLFYLLSLFSVFIFFYGFLRHISFWKKGVKKEKISISWKGIKRIISDAIFAKRIKEGDISGGIMHLLIFWGFFFLFLGTLLLSFDHYIFHFLKGKIYLLFSSFLEIAGISIIIGIFIASLRRIRLERLKTNFEDLLILLLIFFTAVTGFILEGIRISVQNASWEKYSFLGFAIGSVINGASVQTYSFFWWIHVILSLTFIGIIPYTKLFHIFSSSLSIYLEDQEKRILKAEEKEGKVFSFRDLVHLDACTRCGRCTEVCPSYGVGEPFSPRDFLYSVKKEKFDPKLLWYCTTCGACLERCPVYVPPFEIVRQLRAKKIEDGTEVPSILIQTLERLYKYNNPWVSSKKKRAEWAKDLKIIEIPRSDKKLEYCYFVGCTTSYDTRAQKIARSFTAILRSCGIDFGILGKEEPCCGDIARRVGEDGLFEEQATECMELFREYGIRKIITSSPHCFYTMKKEYPMLNPDFRICVMHYSQFLERLIKEGRISFQRKLDLKVTYHDPCYLGRHSRVFDPPRNVIKAIPGIELIEMKHCRENSLCCGGGGGRLWQEELDVEVRMSERRIMEAAETGAQILITCCPICLIMLEDARKTKGLEDSIKVLDLNELVYLALFGDLLS